jgi:hypothetical protein
MAGGCTRPYPVGVGWLDTADKIASVVGAAIALVALFLTMWWRRVAASREAGSESAQAADPRVVISGEGPETQGAKAVDHQRTADLKPLTADTEPSERVERKTHHPRAKQELLDYLSRLTSDLRNDRIEDWRIRRVRKMIELDYEIPLREFEMATAIDPAANALLLAYLDSLE